jgi:uncharacterized protein YdhG (YjbR/CyaY superfamily)
MLAVSHSVFNDINKLVDNHRRAFAEMTAQQAKALSIYAKSLIPFGLFSQAADLMFNAYKLSNNNTHLEDAIHFYGLAGCFHKAGELLKSLNSIDKLKSYQMTPAIIKFMDKQHVSDNDLERLINLTISILVKHHKTISPDQIEIDLYRDEESQWFHYGISLYDSVDKIIEMNNELVDKSVEECPIQVIQGGFVPVFKVLGN